jgi:hypothetical protein
MKSYELKIIKRDSLYHLVNPEIGSRINYISWNNLISFLKIKFPHSLNRSLYKNVPVYEYKADQYSLKQSIDTFFKQKLGTDIHIEFSSYQDNKFIQILF